MKQTSPMVHYVTHELPLLDNGTKMTVICGKVVAIGLMQYDGAVDCPECIQHPPRVGLYRLLEA